MRPFFEKAKQDHKLDIRIGDAVASMQQLADEGCTFDIVFLDANKTGYLTYYNLVMDHNMLTPTGFIVVDNALMKVCVLHIRSATGTDFASYRLADLQCTLGFALQRCILLRRISHGQDW